MTQGEPPEARKKLHSLKFIQIGGKEVVIAHEVGSERPSKLSPEARKERRADNKAAKLSRQKHRNRRKHGR